MKWNENDDKSSQSTRSPHDALESGVHPKVHFCNVDAGLRFPYYIPAYPACFPNGLPGYGVCGKKVEKWGFYTKRHYSIR